MRHMIRRESFGEGTAAGDLVVSRGSEAAVADGGTPCWLGQSSVGPVEGVAARCR